MSTTTGFTIKPPFEGEDPAGRQIYDRILKSSRKFGAVGEEPKKTSIRLVNRNCIRGRSDAQERNHPDHQERSQALKSAQIQIRAGQPVSSRS
jgi:hypothetical protein